MSSSDDSRSPEPTPTAEPVPPAGPQPVDPTPAAAQAGPPDAPTPVAQEKTVFPVLPLRTDVPFPHIIMPLVVGREKGILLIDEALRGDKLIALAAQTDSDVEDPGPDGLQIGRAHV